MLLRILRNQVGTQLKGFLPNCRGWSEEVNEIPLRSYWSLNWSDNLLGFFFLTGIFIRAKRIQPRLFHSYLKTRFNIIHPRTRFFLQVIILFSYFYWTFVRMVQRRAWVSSNLPEIRTGHLPNTGLRPSSPILLPSSHFTQQGTVRTKSDQLGWPFPARLPGTRRAPCRQLLPK
jgi:hypothetical protein